MSNGGATRQNILTLSAREARNPALTRWSKKFLKIVTRSIMHGVTVNQICMNQHAYHYQISIDQQATPLQYCQIILIKAPLVLHTIRALTV